jgi:hypothetical protein
MGPIWDVLAAETPEARAVLREKVRQVRATLGSLPLIDDSETVVALLYTALTHARWDGVRVQGVFALASKVYGMGPIVVQLPGRDEEDTEPFRGVQDARQQQTGEEQREYKTSDDLAPGHPVRVLHAAHLAKAIVSWLNDERVLNFGDNSGATSLQALETDLTNFLRSLIGEPPQTRKDIH